MLRAIKKKWETPAVTIDTTVASVSRIGRLLGTHNYKGGHIGRQATIIDAPQRVVTEEVVPPPGVTATPELLAALKPVTRTEDLPLELLTEAGHGGVRAAAEGADRKGPRPATRHVLVARQDREGAGCQHHGSSQRQGHSIRAFRKAPTAEERCASGSTSIASSAPARTTRRTGSRYTRPRASPPAAIIRNAKARACSISWQSSPRSWRPKPRKATTTPTGWRGGSCSRGPRWSSGRVLRTAIRTARTARSPKRRSRRN